MIHRPLGTRSVALLAAVSMAACVPAASRNAASRPLPPGFDARTVELRYYWVGMPGSREVDQTIRLERQGDTYTFTGTVELQVGGTKAGPLPVTVPDSAMLAFLRTLASARRRQGVYHTIYTHTDDYPEVTMTLRSDAGVVEFFSNSHSRENWRVTIGGQQYVSRSTAASDAWGISIPSPVARTWTASWPRPGW